MSPMQTPVIELIDWFDPTKISHISAYKTLHDTGSWPEDFIPPNVIYGRYNQLLVMNKIVEWFLEMKEVEIIDYRNT